MADREYLKERILPAYSGVHALALRMNSLTDHQMTDVRAGAKKLSEAPMVLIDLSSPSLADIRQGIKEHRPAVVFLDHIHRCKFPRAENQNLAINRFITGLKSIARDLNLPIVAAAQLNRSADNPDIPPSLRHLRDSGALEMESDIVILLHRKSRKDAEILANVAKNRHGESGTAFRMELDKGTLLLGDPSEKSPSEWQAEI
jgi:replicative DNA helicase